MNSKRKMIRQLLPVFMILVVLFETTTYLTTVPRPTDAFFQLYMLGPDGNASNYYPDNSRNLRVGEAVSWDLEVVNDMGSIQYVAVRVKLGNLTLESPNDTLGLPSPTPLVAEFKQFMQNNGTWRTPFEWQVSNFTTSSDGHVDTLRLMINNMTYVIQNPPSCLASSCTYSIIFELWTWNAEISDFQFGWWNGNQHRIAWLQLWFGLAPTGHR